MVLRKDGKDWAALVGIVWHLCPWWRKWLVTTDRSTPIRAIKMAKNALLHYNRERSDIDLAVFGGGVSAYTEEPLSGDAHIDHFRKRDLFPNLTFDWNNLFVDV